MNVGKVGWPPPIFRGARGSGGASLPV